MRLQFIVRPRIWVTKDSPVHSRCISDLSNRYPPRIGSTNYEEGDRVLVNHKQGRNVKVKLLPPLRREGTTRTGQRSYEIKHNDIIGKPSGTLYIEASNSENGPHNERFRVNHPTLEEFISLAPRSVTPIYASYSAFMTDLLDIHVASSSGHADLDASKAPRLEILEAGTGHGSLTLHLARAVAAANSPCPTEDTADTEGAMEEAWEAWRKQRRAVVHTIEYVAPRSKDASKLIRSFRGGIYWPHIDFHAGDVGEWIKSEQLRRKSAECEPQQSDSDVQFLDRICLDMPAVDKQIQHVIGAMKDDAKLLVYAPQITQLIACQHEINRLNLPLKMDRVIELGEGISNGRDWDVRFVSINSKQEQQAVIQAGEDESATEDSVEDGEPDSLNAQTNDTQSSVSQATSAIPTMVCRPLVGKLIMGGAFVGLWHKKKTISKPEKSP